MSLFEKIGAWFKKRKVRRKSRKEFNAQLQRMKATTVVFETLNRFKSSGLLYIDFKHQNVTISNLVASFYIEDEKIWSNFLHNVHCWVVYQYSVSEYVRLFHKAKADAEAAAYARNHAITAEQRQQVRVEAMETFDMEQSRESNMLPNLNFIVIGSYDGQPIVVAKLINGEYETAPIPDQLKK